MKYQWVDYPIAMEAKDGVTHGYGWENKQPYLDSYLNITTETDFLNPTGYASEKVMVSILSQDTLLRKYGNHLVFFSRYY